MKFRFDIETLLRIKLHIGILALFMVFLISSLPSSVSAKIGCSFNYQVRFGDTLEKIATRNNVKPIDIVRVNKMQKPYIIYVGQQICIPDRSKSGFREVPKMYARAQAAYFAVSWVIKGIEIQLFNAKASDNFYVRINDPNAEKPNIYKIGMLKTTKKGSKIKTFRLPRDLRTSNHLYVCLKSSRSDILMCNSISKLVHQSYPLIQYSRVPR